MSMSLAEQIALLPLEEQERILADVDPEQLLYDWKYWGRPEQLLPDSDEIQVYIALAGRGFGKLLRLDTPIPTPSGWSTMGNLSVGDQVFDENGKICNVTYVSPVQLSKVSYKITFDDKSEIIADADHEWFTWTKDARKAHGRAANPTRHPAVRTTQEIHDTLTVQNGREVNHSITVAGALQLPEQDLPIHPYFLGCWLGDGTTRSTVLTIHDDDAEELTKHLESVGYFVCGTRVSRKDESYRCAPYNFGEGPSEKISNYYSSVRLLRGKLIKLGIGTKKAIPQQYLRGSYEQRLALLQGLMDTDGYSDFEGNVEFCNTNKNIAEGALELALSLGFKAVMYEGRATLYGKDYGPKYRVCWTTDQPVFRLQRKLDRLRTTTAQSTRTTHRYIKSVVRVPSAFMCCISVDSPSHLYLAGRAMIPTHNTRMGSEWVREKALTQPGVRIGLLGRSLADARDVIIDGQSGILNVHSEATRPEWRPASRRLVWPNGSIATVFTAETPDQLRGQQFHYFWADELAAYAPVPDAEGGTAFTNAKLSTRLGKHPQLLITTTPRRVPELRKLLNDAEKEPQKYYIIRGATADNRSNLPASYLDNMYGELKGTALERQELLGMMLDEDPAGALWTQDLINSGRDTRPEALVMAPHIIIAVDPNVAENPNDECGIIVMGATRHKDPWNRHVYVIEDASIKDGPQAWAPLLVELSRKYGGAPIVVEKNQGHHLITMVLQGQPNASNLRVFPVQAEQSKRLRAEPAVAPYEQGRVHHTKHFIELENQMTSWEPEVSKKSPDRLDALVHGITALVIKPPADLFPSRIRTHSAVGQTMSNGIHRRGGRR